MTFEREKRALGSLSSGRFHLDTLLALARQPPRAQRLLLYRWAGHDSQTDHLTLCRLYHNPQLAHLILCELRWPNPCRACNATGEAGPERAPCEVCNGQGRFPWGTRTLSRLVGTSRHHWQTHYSHEHAALHLMIANEEHSALLGMRYALRPPRHPVLLDYEQRSVDARPAAPGLHARHLLEVGAAWSAGPGHTGRDRSGDVRQVGGYGPVEGSGARVLDHQDRLARPSDRPYRRLLDRTAVTA